MRNTPLVHLEGPAAAMLRANIDTDAIFPSRSKFGVEVVDASPFLFAEWRYAPDGTERPDFVLNQPERRHSAFLIALDNFGCGSSREFAPWALRDFGIRCIVAPSFGSIFESNCHRNGIAPVVLERAVVEDLGHRVEADASLRLTLDLERQAITASDGFSCTFAMAEGPRQMLLHGLDAIGLTLTRLNAIEAFRAHDRAERPWVYTASPAPVPPPLNHVGCRSR
ncbi:3-isopropylmalate dehydratase small subunit [Novosphingobium sp. SG707]|uniref:3-isopropylmalate dehydratase small subunit n=1 Tax=Novosphingobium sp. SG707 TaxID=2586996 RepID=UPI001448172E|nr:3-isopropylmalate dehydratase small subunit [Novosphingobium sp. SG707]NKJ00969.1 3-isopropylmalate/(R)-2-methylmalate dehydratase small subunit [Novosphingobium sp. SG707]